VTPADLALLRGSSAHVVVDDVAAPELDPDAVHHLFRVLRLRDGDVVTVTDGAGAWRPCVAAGVAVLPDGEVRVEMANPDPVTIAWAVPKRERPEWIVQKLTELGVDRIVLLHADRSVVRWEGARAEKHLSRLRTVAVEAVQQSRGVWAPEIVGPLEASKILAECVAAEPGGRDLTAGDRTIAVGPEGGWSDAELAIARDCVSLGDRVLRVETAAVVAAARAVFHPE
jgi:16S rRNA (uracil1498-N3)-methyltransferase